MTAPGGAAERAFREERSAVLATLIRQVGDFQLAEDAVQDAFAAAVATWPRDGVPDSPRAWLLTTARRRAIQHLGMMGQPRTADAILNIYNRQTDRELKEAAIEALFIQQNAETLVALARKETDRELKGRIVQRLSLMRSPAARDYLMELLK